MKKFITICDNVVVKTASPELARIEAEKTQRAREIADSCGLFRVPKIIAYDESLGQIKFELLHNLRVLRDVINSGSTYKSIMHQCGQTLSIIHKELTLPDDMKSYLPHEYCLSGSEVFLHGDFCLGNICLGENDSEIVILDWQTTEKFGGKITYGTRYFDLMWFVYSLFYRPFNRQRYKIRTPASLMAREFIYGYAQTLNSVYCHREFVEYMAKFLANTLEKRKRGFHFKRRLLLLPSHMKLRKFISSFH